MVYPPPQPQPYVRPQEQRPESQRLCGLPKRWFYVLLALLIAIAIGLGVGLGVGLGTKQSSYVFLISVRVSLLTVFAWRTSRSSSGSATSTSPAPSSTPSVDTQYLIGGAISPAYYSTDGAFNGSGIALASQSFSEDLQQGTQGTLVMYFQHHSGEIRWQQLSNEGTWLGGSVSEVVAVDAKNSTPLSAVSYSINGTNTWHIFCQSSRSLDVLACQLTNHRYRQA